MRLKLPHLEKKEGGQANLMFNSIKAENSCHLQAAGAAAADEYLV